MNKNKTIFIITILFILFSMSYWIASLYTDWLWFTSLHYQAVFLKVILSQLSLRIITGLVLFVVLLYNLYQTKGPLLKAVSDYLKRAQQIFDNNVIVIQQPAEQWLKIINKRSLNYLFLIISLMLAFVTSNVFSGDWLTLQKFFNSKTFGAADPIFNKDIGFYVFQLPFFQFVLSFITSTVVITFIAVSIIYFFIEVLNSNGRLNLFKLTQGQKHLSILGAFFFLLKAVGFYFSQYNLLFTKTSVVHGAGYTDIHVVLPALKVLAVLSIITAILIIVNMSLRKFRMVMYSVLGLAVTAIVLTGVLPSVVERLIVLPNQFNKESSYIADNIKYTRQAYKLNDVEVAKFPAGKTLNINDIDKNRQSIDNIRLWDWQPLQQTYSQLQEMRLYYEFSDIDIDRYIINNKYRQVMLAARELNQNQLPSQAKTWVNQKLIYTHGYGVTMSPVNEVTSEGLPQFFVKDIPPKSTTNIQITRPEIYFGEEPNDYIIVNTKTKEFNYPLGDKNVYSNYEGDSGIKLDSFARKLLFSYTLSDYKMLLTSDITKNSQVLMYRSIKERVPKIAPFLSYDDDPYIVVSNSKLYWLWDAYTTTNMYPYSEPFQGQNNYIRNSVKVLVDAYTGDVNFYVADKEDPLIACYRSIFPNMFKDLSAMPADLREHVRYPIDFFNTQAQMYTNYHMTNTQVFYNKEDRWELPSEVFAGEETNLQPYYTITKLPDSTEPEFVQILPFTPTNKKNMIAWMAGRSDGANYGRLLLYEFPKQQLVYGPMQIEARIDQDTTISQQLTLWNQRGSSVIRGNLLVIPVKDALLYVEPMYLKSEKSSMPELRRVIVAHGDKVVMEPTLDLALKSIFGENLAGSPDTNKDKTKGTPVGEQSLSDQLKEANRLYDAAQGALKSGDWSTYGENLKQLKDVLNSLSQQAGK